MLQKQRVLYLLDNLTSLTQIGLSFCYEIRGKICITGDSYF